MFALSRSKPIASSEQVKGRIRFLIVVCLRVVAVLAEEQIGDQETGKELVRSRLQRLFLQFFLLQLLLVQMRVLPSESRISPSCRFA